MAMRAASTEKTQYRGVKKVLGVNGEIKYQARGTVTGYPYKMLFDTERDAALHVDKMRIQSGKKPVNILKKQ